MNGNLIVSKDGKVQSCGCQGGCASVEYKDGSEMILETAVASEEKKKAKKEKKKKKRKAEELLRKMTMKQQRRQPRRRQKRQRRKSENPKSKRLFGLVWRAGGEFASSVAGMLSVL